jgi:hypothetical protein
MSAKSQSQKSWHVVGKSALTPIADFVRPGPLVRFVPIADIRLFDDLVGHSKQGGRQVDAESLGGL